MIMCTYLDSTKGYRNSLQASIFALDIDFFVKAFFYSRAIFHIWCLIGHCTIRYIQRRTLESQLKILKCEADTCKP